MQKSHSGEGETAICSLEHPGAPVRKAALSAAAPPVPPGTNHTELQLELKGKETLFLKVNVRQQGTRRD